VHRTGLSPGLFKIHNFSLKGFAPSVSGGDPESAMPTQRVKPVKKIARVVKKLIRIEISTS